MKRAIEACHFNFRFWNHNPLNKNGELILESVIFIFHILFVQQQ